MKNFCISVLLSSILLTIIHSDYVEVGFKFGRHAAVTQDRDCVTQLC